MPVFNDLKKLFFGAKSVAKHQASKAGETARQVGDDLANASEDLIDSTKLAARELMDKAPGYIAKGKDALEDLSDKIWRDADAAVDKGKELKDKASESINRQLDELKTKPAPPTDPLDFSEDFDLGDLVPTSATEAPKGKINFEEDLIEDQPGKFTKATGAIGAAASSALDGAAKAGATAKEQAGKLAEKVGEVSEEVGAKVLEKGDELLSRAAEMGADMKGKFNEFVTHANTEAEKMKIEESIEAAKRAAEQAEARARAFDGQESARDTSESVLGGTDSFFDRADRFAKGDYHNEGGKDMTIKTDPDAKPKKEGGMINGFTDSDGDGDSLIDDAVIDED